MFSLSSRVLHAFLPQWGAVAAGGSISFKSQEEHSLIDDVTFCGLLQQFYCLYVGCQFFICATVQLIISHIVIILVEKVQHSQDSQHTSYIYNELN